MKSNNHIMPINDESQSQIVINNVRLSLRESQCITRLLTGKTAKEIAADMSLSHRTVEHYLENIRNKLGVVNKYQLLLKLINCEQKII